MRKSPGFEVGCWLKLLSSNPWFCATYISETIRSCLMQQKTKNHTVLSLKRFWKAEEKSQSFPEIFGRHIESDLRKVMLEWAKLF